MTFGDEIQRWNKTVQAPVRFTMLALLCDADIIEFGRMRQLCGISAQTLSKQATILSDAGYLTIHKIPRGRQVSTELSITEQGRAAFHEQVELLRRLAATAQQPIYATDGTDGSAVSSEAA